MTLRQVLESNSTIHIPHWIVDNLCYETIMGSVAYGVSSDNSDMDVYGICFPPKEKVFPHLAGEILGFGRQIQRFETWQTHHIKALEKTWDFQIYSIVKWFNLAMENNPNIIDSIFTPRRCIISSTSIGEFIRENRKKFLHKGSWHKFKGYAYSQLKKIKTKKAEGKRVELIEKYGYDVKFAYHVVRLLLEVEMILAEGDLDLERHREQLKEIRRGGWSLEKIEEWASDKEKNLEKLYVDSKIPYKPDEEVIKRLLLDCLEHHYGSLSKVVSIPGEEKSLLQEIAKMTERFR